MIDVFVRRSVTENVECALHNMIVAQRVQARRELGLPQDDSVFAQRFQLDGERKFSFHIGWKREPRWFDS